MRYAHSEILTLKILYSISRRNPKIRRAGDVKIPGDGDAEAVPGLGDFATPEIGRRVRDKSAMWHSIF
jgi:hypothetical protein